jgi:hypothetical protein
MVTYTNPLTPETSQYAGATFAVGHAGEVTAVNEQGEEFARLSRSSEACR